jgi:hypothetical protein
MENLFPQKGDGVVEDPEEEEEEELKKDLEDLSAQQNLDVIIGREIGKDLLSEEVVEIPQDVDDVKI